MIEKEKLPISERKGEVRIAVKSVEEAKGLILAYPEAFTDFEVEKGTMDDVFLKVTGKSIVEGGAANE
jgi:multidrug/hemolysin transport system ATP-binding protein